MKNQKGFTLIELLIAAALMAVILTGLYTSFQIGLAALRQSENYLARERDRSIFFSQMEQELRNAVPFSLQPFTGNTDQIKFSARLRHYTPKGLEEGMYVIEYQCKNGELSRQETRLQKANFTASNSGKEILFSGMRQCDFAFLALAQEGASGWTGEWKGQLYAGLPRGVKVQMAGGSFGVDEDTYKIFIPQGILRQPS